jgi:hypothetical protein
MSGISIGPHGRIAPETLEGDVRSRQDDQESVKGALGKLGVTVLEDIGSGLSRLHGDNPRDVRVDRQTRALNGFKEALTAK